MRDFIFGLLYADGGGKQKVLPQSLGQWLNWSFLLIVHVLWEQLLNFGWFWNVIIGMK